MDLSSEVEQLKSEISSHHEAASYAASHHTTDDRQGALAQGALAQSHPTRRIDVGVGETLARHDCDEFGIEGLTIVLHMRGKDDLVINTDLEKESNCGFGG